MPELPEVEVVKMGLAPLKGAIIDRLEVFNHQVIKASPQQLLELKGQRWLDTTRRGKYLCVSLSQDALLIHLRMTGQILLWPAESQDEMLPLPFTFYQRPVSAQDKHTHGIFHFQDGRRLAYRDIRKFGHVWLMSKAEIFQHPALLKLGPEPLETDFHLSEFRQQLAGSQRSIKALLLDQRIVAGLGNIYVDEALFISGVRPERPSHSLKATESKKLFEAIPQVLRQGIASGGTSLRDYVQANGQRGEHQEQLWVYGRSKQPCLRCQTPLIRTVVAQRGTHYCPHCQH